MQLRSLGRTGLKVSRLGLGTMTWGRDTDEHEARDQLIAFAEAGGTLVDTAAGYTDGDSESLIGTLIGDVVARDEIVLATKAGISRRTGERITNTARGYLLSTPRRLAEAARGRPRRPVAGPHLERRDADRGDADRARPGGDLRAGGVRRHLELHRLADRAGRHLAAGGARTGHPSPPPRSSTPCSTARSSARSCRPAPPSASASFPWSPLGRGVLTGKYRTGTPNDSRGASPIFANFVGAYLDDRSHGIVEAVAKAADGLGWTPLEVALVWVRDRPGVTAPIVGARTAAQLRGALDIEGKSLPAEICEALEDVSEQA